MCTSARAISPPIPKPLAERVKAATHIFVGTAKDAWVVDTDGRRVTLERDDADPFAQQGIEIKVHVEEILRPADWQPKTNVSVRIGGGFFGAPGFRERLVGKKFIYITVADGSVYRPSYGWDLTEPVDKKSEVEGLIKAQSK
jgi:hypothetical protein